MGTDPSLSAARAQRLYEVLAEYLEAAEASLGPERRQWLDRHPDLAAELAAFFANQDRIARLAEPPRDLKPDRRAGVASRPTVPTCRGASAHRTPSANPATMDYLSRTGPAVPQKSPATAHAAQRDVRAASTGDEAIDTQGSPTAAPVGGNPQPGRFTILGLYARGGLGQVSLAQDHDLERRVALKEIRADRLNSPFVRERFLNEAKITGYLEHPGIVPVYALGHDEQDWPFYAMRFIEGRTLADAIRAYYQQPTPLAFNDLLRRFVTVCQTIAYAHSKDVIHRDLKPANIMLGEYGETLVLDWGLAKRIGRKPLSVAGGTGTDAFQPGEGQPLTPDEEQPPTDQDPLTQAGQILGTAAYMSPEQAEGHSQEVGPATDVYALGVILYQVLTGKTPYPGKDLAEVLARVRTGMPPPPSQVRRSVPRVLEAVCLKAMARHPAGRYATPMELAHEVERWLADEPVSAYRESFSQHMGRWARQHKPLVAGLLALLVTAIIVLPVSTILILWEKDRAEQADAGMRAILEARKKSARDEEATNYRLQGVLKLWGWAIEKDDGSLRLSFRLQRAARLACAGEHAKAVTEADALAEQKSLPGEVLYGLAWVYALSINVGDPNEKLVEQYGARAVECLRRAAAAGFFKGDPAKVMNLSQDRDFAPLRRRGDFQKLLRDLK